MVRILSVVGLVLTIALGAEASHLCQCLFADRSHCCASTSVQGPYVKCETICQNAARGSDNKPCNANGAWSKVSAWNVQWRQGCAPQAIM
ncbi:hypothetical protein DDE82_004590 [Stemphylium lycopersici]|uniref:Uncharacterized protein n=1 Tax=Stemphylium lycopersici TaxID=183478 RepID=A0A364N3P6_STELY|nr:hypothetical protein TW65_02949 [Stemphylium lycopersici]RAR04385.1 hypothetical protein DDE82_004590 [Stemphylium lycopersici]RAR10780.1 hypothetical protein DDE83_004924 [Stemphylium lycopersici]